jgi:hypothetical protein
LGIESVPIEMILKSSRDPRDEDLQMSRSASISGTVKDENGLPMAEVVVSWKCSLARGDSGTAHTQSDGSYKITHLFGACDYRPTVRAETGGRFSPAEGGSFPTVTLDDAFSQASGNDLRVSTETASISGRVVNLSGAPVANVPVVVPRDGPATDARIEVVASTRTDPDGRFNVGPLFMNNYTVAVGEGGELGSATDVRAGTNGLVIILPGIATVHVSVDGFSVGPVAVGYLGELAKERGFTWAEGTSATGVDFESVPDGERWFIAIQGNTLALEQVPLGPSPTSEIVLRALPSARLSGTLIGCPAQTSASCMLLVNLPSLPDIVLARFQPGPDGNFTGR